MLPVSECPKQGCEDAQFSAMLEVETLPVEWG